MKGSESLQSESLTACRYVLELALLDIGMRLIVDGSAITRKSFTLEMRTYQPWYMADTSDKDGAPTSKTISDSLDL